MTIKACIFDLDGVIVDTAKYHFIAWKRLCNTLGFDITEAQNEQLKGVSRQKSLDILLEIGQIKTLSTNEKNDLATQKNQWYLEMVEQMTDDEILVGVVDFLNELKDHKITIGLASASKNAKNILEKVNLIHFFDTITDGNDVAEAKPNPEIFIKTAQKLAILPSQAIVFEDAQAGVEAAKNGGFKCVGIGTPDNLHQADAIMPSFEEFNFLKLKQLFI